ncbi:hypothetical protein K435DRAFT_880383 [Dendrothele bispora CBS 962.96]|uniref:RNase H type-1 domain-containing protein n=1 Tax=Dendrothele bispora (strain CBS 962.96) TaxID=1314807 RepID=A0A4S8KJK1_DENBC|nr:hypothetical protein K435DRAFT_880383 [Dendrothele bispora CBS 962.96]
MRAKVITFAAGTYDSEISDHTPIHTVLKWHSVDSCKSQIQTKARSVRKPHSSPPTLPSETLLDRLYIETINSIPIGKNNALAHLCGFTTSADSQSPLRVFTAGVCYNQSSPLVKAGAGIFFGPGSKFNASSRVPGPSLSPERAHTYAVWQAIKDFPRNRPLIIYTSPYVIKALTAHSERNTNIKWSRHPDFCVHVNSK